MGTRRSPTWRGRAETGDSPPDARHTLPPIGRRRPALLHRLFRALGIVRVYTKTPGKSAETDKPFTVRRGGTVLDVAGLVHKDIAQGLKFARMWGAEVFDGQQVGPDHLVIDGDLVELHL